MSRLAIASLAIVASLASTAVVGTIAMSDEAALAQPASEPPDHMPEPTLRPGQLADPGPMHVSTAGWSTDFSISSVPFDEILSGGPPKDGIPAIDAPRTESIADARGWLDGDSPVISLEVEGQARAYPLAILTWHEIVNDELAGRPVVVTFCPLCHTALVYDRTLEGQVLDFGVSGNLRFSDMIMYDRQTESWWQQATGEGIVGTLTGSKLEFLPAQIIALDQFAASHPEGDVLGRETGHSRRYGANPYVGYDSASDAQPFLFRDADGPIATDGRLTATERVVTLGGGGPGHEPIAFPYAELRAAGVAHAELAGGPVVVFWTPGATSALDGPSIDDSREVGSTGVFSPLVEDRVLSFRRGGGEGDVAAAIVDEQTGSTWDVTGRATSGPLAGATLDPIAHGDHFWFAWAAFSPDTRIWQRDGTILDGIPSGGP